MLPNVLMPIRTWFSQYRYMTVLQEPVIIRNDFVTNRWNKGFTEWGQRLTSHLISCLNCEHCLDVAQIGLNSSYSCSAQEVITQEHTRFRNNKNNLIIISTWTILCLWERVCSTAIPFTCRVSNNAWPCWLNCENILH